MAVGELAGRRVAFLPRHGVAHEFPAHQVNYRANLWALRRLGVTRVLAPCSVGSLQPELRPGDFVICDQIVDRTRNRADTYFDGPVLNCISFADPYCPEVRSVATAAAERKAIRVHGSGTVVVIEGPRFSTRAESRWFRDAGWHVVNMTQYPEAVLARELGVCYSGIALVTDYDCGLEGVADIEPVDMATVLRVLGENVERVQDLIGAIVEAMPATVGCGCATGAVDPGTGLS